MGLKKSEMGSYAYFGIAVYLLSGKRVSIQSEYKSWESGVNQEEDRNRTGNKGVSKGLRVLILFIFRSAVNIMSE
jgi:hypothetical protein